EGLAADVRFVGTDLRALWERVRALNCCGAGYYKTGQFLHLDVGRPRFWEETTSRAGENLSAGDAGVFARSDFDRYESIDGAIVSLHAVTLRPLRIDRTAELIPEADSRDRSAVRLERVLPAGETVRTNGDCFILDEPPAHPPDRFVVRRDG